jgi:hypothetical protein
MPVQYADKPKQPGEALRYSMTFTPGVSLGSDDSLTGTATVTIQDVATGADVTSTMLVAGSVSRSGNTVYAKVTSGTNGNAYKVTFKCNTTNGEEDVEEDLVVEVREY